jgi:hypothetical protein
MNVSPEVSSLVSQMESGAEAGGRRRERVWPKPRPLIQRKKTNSNQKYMTTQI